MVADDARLRWIARAGLTDPGDRAPFDRIVRLVQHALGTPVALVSTVTDRAQVFSGRIGVETSETPLSHSLCQIVVEQRAALVLPDTHADARVCDHPAVRDLRVRAYLGVPFCAPSGDVLGSVCAIDVVPRAWTDEDEALLRDFAALVETEVALRLDLADRTDIEVMLRRDLADRDAVEEGLRHRNDQLGHDVRTHSDDLRGAYERLAWHRDELTRRHDELRAFTSMLSHDLAEPVRKIRTFASLLRPVLPTASDVQMLERLEQTAERMHGHLRALAAYAQASLSDAPDARAVDLAALVQARVARLTRHDARLTHEGLPVVQGFPDMLARLFDHLLDNALRFRRATAPLNVHVSAQPTTHAGRPACEVRVTDTGQGFAPRHAERLFAPFQRLHAAVDGAGAGLGLALCRRIAERHGGTLTAEGRPGEGATFTLVLPLDGPPTP